MKKYFCLIGCALILCSFTAKSFDFDDFINFYSVFSEMQDKVLLMPDKLRLELSPGSSADINLVTRPENLDVEWESSSDNVCKIAKTRSGCRVTATGVGDATLTVREKDARASARVRVHVVSPETQLSLDKQEIQLMPGESAIIHANVTNAGKSPVIKWSAGDCVALSYGENICRVKAIKAGQTRLIATVDDMSSTAQITVKQKEKTPLNTAVVFLVLAAVILILYAISFYGKGSFE